MANIIETCGGCGSRDLVQERDAGWLTGSWRMIRCRTCGQKILRQIPAWTLALYAIATAAAISGWILLFR